MECCCGSAMKLIIAFCICLSTYLKTNSCWNKRAITVRTHTHRMEKEIIRPDWRKHYVDMPMPDSFDFNTNWLFQFLVFLFLFRGDKTRRKNGCQNRNFWIQRQLLVWYLMGQQMRFWLRFQFVTNQTFVINKCFAEWHKSAGLNFHMVKSENVFGCVPSLLSIFHLYFIRAENFCGFHFQESKKSFKCVSQTN